MQFMQVSLSNHKSIESAIKNLEVQVGQLVKQLAERPTRSFMANTKKNPKEECKAVVTRSRKKENVEKEKRAEGVLEDVRDEEGEDKKKEEGERKENNDEVLIPKTKSQLAWKAIRSGFCRPAYVLPICTLFI